MRRGIAIAAVALAVFMVVWWPMFFGPLVRGGIVVGSIYTSALYGSNALAGITAAPRVSEDRVELPGGPARVTWFVPGSGARHAAMLVVNGATALGNDDPETRRLCDALARAGYLVMLPQFSFLTEGRLERAAPASVDAAFAALLRRTDVDPQRAGAFGFSVGGGILFAAAGAPGAALHGARYLGALGAYFDIDTYLASVVSGTQRRGGTLERWTPDAEVRLKLPRAAAEALADARDRDRVIAAINASGGPLPADVPAELGPEARALWTALAETGYESALQRLEALPAGLRRTFDGLSPVTTWSDVTSPVYWLHDEGDRFEPVSEAENAAASRRAAPTRLHLTRLISHAAALGQDAERQGLVFLGAELGGLLGFALEVLRRAG